MSDLKIEKGIPLPARTRQGGMSQVMREMVVGDSVLWPLAKRTSLNPLAARLAIKIATRKEGVDHVRVWRTA